MMRFPQRPISGRGAWLHLMTHQRMNDRPTLVRATAEAWFGACISKCNADECYKVFKSASALMTHKALTHRARGHNNGFQCFFQNCHKSFLTKRDLIIHNNTHFGLRPFRCDKCKMAFSANSNLIAHKNRRHLAHLYGPRKAA
mmetsp:Transcript_3418/g.5297  ORF Transcript_3418/g.5297 Transcript_3418/m.5297 type:complete len:143 (+) Transcript_3418:26-454(+)